MDPTSQDAPARVVQRQLDAYNARDIDGFMACWAADAACHDFPDRPAARGAAAIRAAHLVRFAEADLFARLAGRLVMEEMVVDREVVLRNLPEGRAEIDVLAIYRVERGRIAEAWFRRGTPRPLPPGAATLRLARPEERGLAQAIVESAYGHYVARMGRKPGPMEDDYAARIARRQLHLLCRDGVPIGLLVLVPEEGAMLLDNIAVDPAVKGQGYGRQLLEFAESAARAAGYRAIRLYTNEKMVENIGLYGRIGYVETHRATLNGRHAVFMTKAL
jgi:predicted N-acetyltransferase YhbS